MPYPQRIVVKHPVPKQLLEMKSFLIAMVDKATELYQHFSVLHLSASARGASSASAREAKLMREGQATQRFTQNVGRMLLPMDMIAVWIPEQRQPLASSLFLLR